MAQRTGSAKWEGSLKAGEGTVVVGDGVWEGPYSFSSRFEEGDGTNPEELIGAAHAGCFTMFLSGVLDEAGHTAESLETTASVHLRTGDEGPSITKIELALRGRVPGIDQEEFQRHAETAKKNCPVSKALAGVAEMTVDAQVEG